VKPAEELNTVICQAYGNLLEVIMFEAAPSIGVTDSKEVQSIVQTALLRCLAMNQMSHLMALGVYKKDEWLDELDKMKMILEAEWNNQAIRGAHAQNAGIGI